MKIENSKEKDNTGDSLMNAQLQSKWYSYEEMQ